MPMDTARIERRIGVRATPDRIWEIISDLPGWSRWNPVETEAAGVIAFGGEITATETVDGLEPRPVIGRVGDWQPYSQLVWTESRGLWFRTTRYYEIDHLEDGGACIVANGFIFHGLRGEMFFDKNRGRLRRSVDAVSEAIKTLAES